MLRKSAWTWKERNRERERKTDAYPVSVRLLLLLVLCLAAQWQASTFISVVQNTHITLAQPHLKKCDRMSG